MPNLASSAMAAARSAPSGPARTSPAWTSLGVYQAFRVHRPDLRPELEPDPKHETVHGITSLTVWQAKPDLLAGNRGPGEVEMSHGFTS